MIRYVFREAPVTIKNAKQANPQHIGEALEKIAEQNDGRLTPTATVEAAASERHVLHAHFEWDDPTAAAAHRLDQARNLIRSIRVIDDATPDVEPAIAFVSVNTREGHSYYSKSAVEASRTLQGLVLAQAERDLEAWEKRYSELVDICRTVREARERLAARRRRHLEIGDEAHPAG